MWWSLIMNERKNESFCKGETVEAKTCRKKLNEEEY